MPVFEIEVVSEQTGRVYVVAENIEAVQEAWDNGELEDECFDWQPGRYDAQFHHVANPKPNQGSYAVEDGEFVTVEEYEAKHGRVEVPAFFEDKHTIPMPL